MKCMNSENFESVKDYNLIILPCNGFSNRDWIKEANP